MLVRVGQAVRIKLPATISNVSESLPSSLDTRFSQTIRFCEFHPKPGDSSPGTWAIQPERFCRKLPTCDAGANFNDGCCLSGVYFWRTNIGLTGAPVVALPRFLSWP